MKHDQKTILHLIPGLSGGGAEYQLINILKFKTNLSSYKFHIGIRTGNQKIIEDLKKHGVEIHVFGNHRSYINPILLFKIIILTFKIKPDVIQTWLPQMDIIGGLAAKIQNITHIISERSSAHAYKYSKDFLLILRSVISKNSKCIIANSRSGKKYWDSKNYKGQISIINNGIDFENIKKSLVKDFFPNKFIHDSFNFIVVGRLSEEKKVINIVEAFGAGQHNSDIKLIIIGDGPERKSIEDRIKQLNLRDQIILLGWVDDWWSIFIHTRCLISCSLYEGQSNILYEAIAAKCPTIISDISSHREVLSDDETNYFDPNNIDELVIKINDVIHDYKSQIIKSEMAYNKVKKNTFLTIANQYISVYEKLLTKK